MSLDAPAGRRRSTHERPELLDLIAAMYEAGAEPEKWPEALGLFAELFGAAYGGLILAGPNDRIEQIGSLGSDPSFSRSYGEYYGHMDPIMPAVITAAEGTMLTDTMVMPKAALERTEFHHDWVRPQGYYSCLAANFIREGAHAGAAVLSRRRREGDFHKHDLDLLAALTPHLRRAMQMNLRLAALRIERDAALGALDRMADGILVVDQSCRILLANRIAERMLAEADGIGSERSGLHTASPAQTDELRRLVAQAAGADRPPAAGGALSVDRPSLKRPLQVLISPLRAETGWAGPAWRVRVVLLLIIDPERAPGSLEERLRALFKLTPAEARVAREIATGENLVGIAETLGILTSTARTHLHRVFAKTETRRQAELVKLIERITVLRTDMP